MTMDLISYPSAPIRSKSSLATIVAFISIRLVFFELWSLSGLTR